ncbi:hypothetical protein ACGGAI_27395 [Streptomyces antibioticus]|uniref:hypothetical protein n=1 Tax=Streptomyces antibioticus TaxID=1890 RepID=UPI0037138A37
MILLRCRATRLVDEGFPGWVEVVLRDAHGRVWTIVDKGPVFGGAGLGPETGFPVEVTLEGTPTGVAGLVRVSTDPHHVAAEDGTDEFEVFPEQLLIVGGGPQGS